MEIDEFSKKIGSKILEELKEIKTLITLSMYPSFFPLIPKLTLVSWCTTAS